MNFLPMTKHLSVPPHLFSKNDGAQSMTQQDIDRLFARCFSSDDGKKVLAHLQVMTFARAHGPDISDTHLRYVEGQRALVASVMRMVDRGRSSR